MARQVLLRDAGHQVFDELDAADVPSGVLTSEQFAGDGVTDTFTLGNAPTSAYAIVTVNGAQVTTYSISGDDVIFDTAPDNDAEVIVNYVYGGGIVSPDPDLAMRIIGPFTVNYNDANVLTTGVELFEAEAGYVIYNMWPEVSGQFAGSGGWSYSFIRYRTANDELVTTGVQSYLAVTGTYAPSGTDVAARWVADMLGLQVVGDGGYGENWFPARIKNTVPILLKLVPDAGTMTAGQLKVYAMVGELA